MLVIHQRIPSRAHSVELHLDFAARSKCRLRCFSSSGEEVGLDSGDVVQGHGCRHIGQMRAEGHGRRGDGLPAARIVRSNMVVAFPGTVGAGLAPGVGDLDTRHRATGLDRAGNTGHALGLLVIPQPGASGADAPFRGYRSGLDDHQTGAATGQAGVMMQVPVRGHTIDSAVLAHGRHRDAVAQGDVLQLERGKQCRHGQSSQK